MRKNRCDLCKEKITKQSIKFYEKNIVWLEDECDCSIIKEFLQRDRKIKQLKRRVKELEELVDDLTYELKDE